MNFTEGNLSGLIDERVGIATVNAQRKKITLSTDLQKVSNCMFDAERFRQVADNLITNAIKFSPAETNIHLTCQEIGNSIEIAVSDQGPGIPPEEIDKLFGAFQTLSTRPTGGEKSTGLGLSIAKQIVDSHGGNIEVESKIGIGTTFVVRIPIEKQS